MSPVCLAAQSIRLSGPQNPHIDYSRLQRIDKLIDEYIGNHWLNGCIMLIIKDNQVIRYKGQGYAGEAAKKPIPANAIFRIMSQTKTITSAAMKAIYAKAGIPAGLGHINASLK
jgi:CubicO group peptidase (beta-lactamase class C family)